jgi:hypothetical protein
MTPSAILSASRQQHISFRTTAIHTMDRRSFDSNGRQASPTAAPVMRNHRPRFHGVAVGLCRRTDGRGALAAGACYTLGLRKLLHTAPVALRRRMESREQTASGHDHLTSWSIVLMA